MRQSKALVVLYRESSDTRQAARGNQQADLGIHPLLPLVSTTF